jgi:proton-dependent oligopeptide transporter, POT family
MNASLDLDGQKTLFGHPTGLFVLFFAEMWERFSYYGMRALLILYMIKGFLKYTDNDAYAVYGAYTSLVYATPFIGGMLADKLLGSRRAVILGGLLMAAGHLLMTMETKTAFFVALALIICGNGFFKPNISTIVGTLYPERSEKRDSGFTIFYIGINLGAAMSGLICGYVGETWGWHYGFGLATIGMLVGLSVFWAPVIVSQIMILVVGWGTGIGMLMLGDDPYTKAINAFVAVALAGSATIAFIALGRGGLPEGAGAPPEPERLRKPLFLGLRTDVVVYLGVLLAIPVVAMLVQRNTIAGWVLIVFGVLAFGLLVYEAVRSPKVERERLFVVLILMFFSMLFWSFFEQAGSSVNNFTDRNVDRVIEDRVLTDEDVGETITMTLNQAQLGWERDGKVVTMTALDEAREADATEVSWTVGPEHVGMAIGGAEIKTTVFQSANPIYILIFGLIFSWLWGFLGRRGLDPPIPVKFGMGLAQLGLGFVALWYGATQCDDQGMVGVGWLLVGYLLHTTGELCLSPVGLSMVTKLSPARMVGAVMGAWFLATAFSAYLAGLIATLTGVEHAAGEEASIPAPLETVGVYGDVFGKIAIAALVSAAIVFVLSPLLKKWMHAELNDGPEGGGGH